MGIGGVSETALHQVMKTHTNTHETSTPTASVKARRIKLGIDVHADSYRVIRQIDNATPQPAQKFTPAEFLQWARKQLTLAEEVYTCYEAGPFGYGLHRELVAMGIHNIVVRPQDWDELHKRVKTDKTDALALVQRLSRYVDGNKKELAVIHVPTPEQELARTQSRFREQLLEHRKRMEAQGRSLLLYYGQRVKGRWWKGQAWEEVRLQTHSKLVEQLTQLQELLEQVEKTLNRGTKQIEAAAKPQVRGTGALTSQVIEREVLDWNRFTNRRQVASLTGMCPSVHSSGNQSRSGSITKHGNPRIRTALVELAWRWVVFQPDYAPLKKWRPVLLNNKAAKGAKKKAIVAIGRRIAIDLWRLGTGRTTAEKLNLK